MKLKHLSLLSLFFILVACGSGNQEAIDDFFDVGQNEDNADSGSLVYNTKEFREVVVNNGAIDNKINIELKGRLFVGVVGEDFIGSKINVSNIPSGLTITSELLSTKEIQLTLSGNAAAHANVDDIGNLEVVFLDAAFNAADNISGKSSNLIVNYRDPYVINYATSSLSESGDNNGSVSDRIALTVNDLNFAGNISDDFVADGKANVSNIPPGMNAELILSASNLLTLRLTGNSISHGSGDSISNLTVTLLDGAFPSGVSALTVGNSTKNDIGLQFFDPATISYLPVSETLTESIPNIGEITDQFTISVAQDTFSGTSGDDFVAAGKVLVSNIPAGMSARVVKANDTTVILSLDGQAVAHVDANDINNLTVQFNASAFNFNTNAANVVNGNKSDLQIDFNDPYVLSFNTKNFQESGDNDGTVTTQVTATLAGTTFNGSNGEDFVSSGKVFASNIPSGLTLVATQLSNTQLRLTFTGTAVSHESANDLSNIVINFLDSAFATNTAAGISNSSNSDFTMSFRDPVSLSYSGSKILESSANNGSISNEIDITLFNDTFTGTAGENFLGNGKASITPNPVTTGLVAIVEKVSNTVVRLKFSGNATVHDIDITGITLQFNQTAFALSTSTAQITGATKNDFELDFYDKLTYSTTSLSERGLNDGAIDETITIDLTGTAFTGSPGDNLVALGKAVVTNIPTGLSAQIILQNSKQAVLSLTGTANDHEVADNLSNIGIAFTNAAFTSGSATGVEDSNITNVSLSFLDSVNIAYSGRLFNEAIANDGSIANDISLTLTGDTFTGSNGENFLANGKATFTPALPSGLSITLIKVSSTLAELRISGNAVSHDIDEGPYTLVVDDTAFSINTDTTNIVGASKNDFGINYNDTISFSTKIFSERAENDGQFSGTITLSLSGTQFTGNNGDDFVADGKLSLVGVPNGLTMVATRNSATEVELSLTGTAVNHSIANDVVNLGVSFENTAFIHGQANSVGDAVTNDTQIRFLDPVSITYSGDIFNESSANDGSIDNNITLTLVNDTYTGIVGDDLLADGKAVAHNIPLGLTAELRKLNDTTARLSLLGNASSHHFDLNNIEVIVLPTAMTITTNTLNVANETKLDISINYYDYLTYSTKSVTEQSLNDGGVSETANIQISGTQFSGSNGDDFVSGGKVIISNVPAGLTPSIVRTSSTQLTLSFAGQATNHESSDGASNITISFLDSALDGSGVATLEDATISDFAVNFFDSVALNYSTELFAEDLSNDGSIGNSAQINVINDTFSGTNGEDYLLNGKATITNLPSGLSATIIKTSATSLVVSLNGNAIDHGEIHSINNLTIEIRATGLTLITDTTNVLNAINNGLEIDYISPSTLQYSGTTYNESSVNDGAMENNLVIDIDGQETFTGSIGDNLISSGKVAVNNVPVGMTAVVEKTASKQVRVLLNGNAVSHEQADSITNLEVDFNSSAFTFNQDISLVNNANVNNINVNFTNTAVITFEAPSTFTEATANIGVMGNTLDIDLAEDTFTGANGENYLATSKAVVSNVPTGLVPRVEKISATKLRLSFTGSATAHENSDDVSDLTVSLQSSAFTFNSVAGNVTDATKSDIIIDYIDPYDIAFSGTQFTETAANTGGVTGSSIITISGTTFTGSNGENYAANGKIIVSNLPSGFTAIINKDSDSQLTFILTGNATSHANVHDISNLTLTFLDGAFTSGDADGVSDSTKNDFAIDFIDPYSLTYDGKILEESVSNIGEVASFLTIDLVGHTFSGVDTDDFVAASKVNVTNVPAGLTAVMTRTSATQLHLSFTGAASSHASVDDIDSIQVTFLDSAFTNGAQAIDVINYNDSDIEIDFNNPYTLSSNGFSFNEAVANNGSITDTLQYTLVGTTFTGNNGDDLAAAGNIGFSNIPSGLTGVATRLDDTNIVFSFTGTADNHEIVDNISNVEIAFFDGAFTSGKAAGVNPDQFTGISISYRDRPTLTYSPSEFDENTANIGGTDSTVSIFAANVNFDGSASENFVASGKVVVSNYPTGLTPVVTYISNTQVNLTFTGTANDHANSDDLATGISVVFQDSAFIGGNAAAIQDASYSSLGFDFIDPYQISYGSSSFVESTSNNGSIGSTVSITLAGTFFTGASNEDFAANGKASVTNLPAGLTAQVTRLSSSLVQVSLNGQATDHTDSDDINNLTIEFADTAFQSGAAQGVTDYLKNDLEIDFKDAASLAFTSSTFNEAVANIGGTSTTIDITVSNDIFTGPNGENYISTGKVAITNLPSGLTGQVNKINDTTLRFSLNGNAVAHEDAHDVNNLTLVFASSAFDFNSDASTVANSTKNDFVIDFDDAYTLSFSGTIFSEATANDGSIGNSIQIDLTGTNFTTTASDFITEGKVSFSNVPSGLTPVVTRNSGTQVEVSFTGQATNNLDSHDIANLTITFEDTAFTSGAAAGVTDSSKSDFAVDFNDQPILSYLGSSFSEAVANTGSITATVDISLSGATFSGNDNDFYVLGTEFNATNTPAGLTARMQKINNSTVRVSFSGSASSHALADSISNFEIQFNDDAFNGVAATNVTNRTKSDFAINFNNPYSVSYSGNTFVENQANVGGSDSTVTITAVGTTFTGNNGDIYSNGVQFSFSNSPSGLTPRLVKLSDTVVQISLVGNAAAHANTNSITNLTINLLDGAFTSGASAGVSNTTKSDFAINFSDPYSATYSGGTFNESNANNGTISDTIDIDLTGTTFTGTNGATYTGGVEYTALNTPGGLSVNVLKISDTKLRVSLTGTAGSHVDANDINNLTIILNNAAFTSGNSSGVQNSSKSDFSVNFYDAASLSFNSTTFTEAVGNDGSIGNTITITVLSDNFTGVNGENYISTGKASVGNVPSGLVASLTKTSNTTVVLSLTGNAGLHIDTDDISNLSLTFNASAFDFNSDASTVANSNRSDLSVNFADPYVLTYSASVFDEASANNGSIGNSLTLTLAGTTFTTTASDFITEGKVSVRNVPSGLTASISRDSSTQLTLSLLGNATNHLDSNDIANLTVVFANNAFVSGVAAGVTNSNKPDIAVDFDDQPTLAYSGLVLTEEAANTGGVAGTIDIVLTGDTFTGNNGDVYTAGKVAFTNVPGGLTSRVEKISDSTVRLSYTGSASSHLSGNSVSSININFLNTAFTNVGASAVTSSSRNDLGVTFRDPYVLSYASGAFNENVANDGSISTEINVDLAGSTFTGSNGAIYSDGVEVSFANAPAGLTPRVTKVDADTVKISFTGNASSHTDSDDISNFSVSFLDAAFASNEADGVLNTTKADFVVDFVPPATLAYSTGTFLELNLNNGAISNSIDVDLVNDTFVGNINDDLVAAGHIAITNIPAGLTAVGLKQSATQVRISLTGNASSHADAQDISNLTVEFQASAFTNNTTASNVTGYLKNDIVVDYEDPYILSYNTTTVQEAGTNAGSINDTITISLIGTTFTGNNGDDFVGSKVIVTNLPSGLTAVVTKDNNNQLTLSFTGSASSHANSNDVSNLTLAFQDSAFASGAAGGVDNSTVSNLVIDFNDYASITYSAETVSEAVTNVGAIDVTLTLTLADDTYVGVNGDDYVSNGKASILNLPTGLTAVLTKTSDTVLTLSFTGNASSHLDANDINNFTITLAASAFSYNTNASLVSNSSKNNLEIDFNDPYTITYSGSTLDEAVSNDGSVLTVLNLNLVGTTYTGVNGENFVGAKASVSNVPSGLTPVLTRVSSGQVQLSFTGNATNHEDSHDIGNLTVTFNDTAFTSGSANGVTNYTKNDLAIDFDDRPVITYPGLTFQEGVKNIGDITDIIDISIAGDLFAAGSFDASKVVASNVPSGLTAVFTRINDTTVRMSFTGNADDHISSDDVNNVTVVFSNNAFQNVAAANITNSTKNDLEINYRDPYQITYSTSTFTESINNDGSIGSTIVLTLTGTTFSIPVTGMLADGMVTITNIPGGLSAAVARDSDTQLTVSLVGQATNHANSNDISNLTIQLNDSAYVSGEADGVVNSLKSDVGVDYNDPASISYSGALLSEHSSNDGSIATTLDIDISGDTFTGSNSDDFVAGAKVSVSNQPSGLTAVVTRISDTKLRLSFTGNADDHENVDDVSNFTLTFNANAFTNNTVASNVVNYEKDDITLDYLDAYVLSYNVTNVNEAVANDGGITASMTISLIGTTFAAGTDFIAEGKVTPSNVPSGLTAVLTRNSATEVELTFTGNADNHENANSIADLTLTFEDSAFTTSNAAGVVDYNKNDLSITYTDQGVISYSGGAFNEASANDGSIGNSLNISIANDTFTGSNSSDYLVDSKATVTNLPTGLGATLVKISDTTLTLTLTGTANDHEDVDDISNLTVTFNNTALTSARADLTVNNVKNDLVVNFSDVVLPEISGLTPPANGYFTESATMSFTVAYSEDVDVTGTPRVVLDIGGVTRYATYTSGTGTATLIFDYQVVATEEDLDGITITSSNIDLNGGTIKKKGLSNDALTSFSIPDTSGVFVDTIDPNAVTALALAASYTSNSTQSPAVSWTNPTGPSDNINHIRIAIGTAPGANNTVDYINIGDVENYTFTGISPVLTECVAGTPKYYPVVRVYDDAGNTSGTNSGTSGFFMDSFDPGAPTVNGVTFDADNTRSATVTWTGGTDNCGVAGYEVAIGYDADDSGGLDVGEVGNVYSWTAVGNVLSHRMESISLNDNVNYYTTVRTVDVSGRKSSHSTSAKWRANFNYRRDITIAPTTTVADSQVMISLDTGNFDYSKIQSDASDIRFFTTGDVALDYWIEHLDTALETRIWVKIPSTGTSTIVMKYGTVNLSDGQDKAAVFSYASRKNLYVEMSNAYTNGQNMNVSSYIDSNSVQVQTTLLPSTQNVDEHEIISFSSTVQGVIGAMGGISARTVQYGRAYDAVTPISSAATLFGYPVSRDNTDRYTFYNPNTTTANVTVSTYAANGTFRSSTPTTVNAGSFRYLSDVDTTNNSIVMIVESDIPIVGYYYAGTARDGNVQPAASTTLFGVPSSKGYVGCTGDGTTFTVYRSSNALRAQDTYTCDRGERVDISDSSYSQGLAPAVRITSDSPVFATSQADSDGNESAAFFPQEQLDRDYIVPTTVEYIVIACPYDNTTVSLYDENDGLLETTGCDANGSFPGKARFLATTYSVSTLPAGHRVRADKPIYMMYEASNQDETSIFGAKGAAQYLENPLSATVSATEY